jgi:CDP-glucose 4,6-dehydratase
MGGREGALEALAINQSFWKDRRVFITGHTGFKGAWLIVMLRSLGAQVSGYSLAPLTPSLFDLLKLEQFCTHTVGDIRDLPRMEAALQAGHPEIVFHLAAQPLVRESYSAPVETYSINVMGTVNLLDACMRLPDLRSLVMITTDKVYENRDPIRGYREFDRLGGDDPYSNSKACCELAIHAYRQSFFASNKRNVGIASARAGNVIGGGDFAKDRLIPDAMAAFARAETLRIRNPLSIRPWQHVLEPLFGYLLVAEGLFSNPALGQSWNFGPRIEQSICVSHIADMLVALWGENNAWSADGGEHPHEAATLKLDATKAYTELGWYQRLSIEDSLRLGVEWYRTFHQGGDLMAITQKQASDYLSEVTAVPAVRSHVRL